MSLYDFSKLVFAESVVFLDFPVWYAHHENKPDISWLKSNLLPWEMSPSKKMVNINTRYS